MQTQSEPRKVYKVLFRGVILPGFEKDDVIKNVHNITRIPEAVIRRKFFSGKTVVIRRADTQDYATRLQKTFAQAGIETHIEEKTEEESEQNQSVNDKSSSDEDFNQFSDSENIQPSESKIKGSNILITIGIAVVLVLTALILLTDIFDDIFDDKESAVPVSKTNNQTQSVVKKTSAQSVNDKTADSQIQPDTQPATRPVKPSHIKAEPAVLFTQDEITLFIKITHLSELERIKSFITLFHLSEKQLAGVKQLLTQPLMISEQEPLYLFSTQKHFGLYAKPGAPLKDLTDSPFLSADNGHCATWHTLSLKQHNKRFLLSSFNPDAKDFYLALEHSLQKVRSLFSSEQLPAETLFYFYMKSPDLPLFKLAASKEQFVFFTDDNFKSKNIEELSGIQFNTLQKTDTSAVDLWNLVLLAISQNKPYTFPKKHLFTEQMTSAFISESPLIPYQKQLDVEFLPQWSDGPFAIKTAAFSFENNHPVIEILAKGQNINTFIEYSAMAQLRTDKVLTRFQQNAMLDNCTADNSRADSRIELFKNIDGEQEAYINEDFVSFKTITARDSLSLSADTQLTDIEEIQGRIILVKPQQVIEKSIDLNPSSGMLVLEDFILLYDTAENNTFNYQVIGNTAQFITLRINNNKGDNIETTDFQYQTQFNQSIKQFKRVFAEPINNGQVKMKVFYSPQYQVKQYPFKFKPAIASSQTLTLPLPDDQPIAPEQDKLGIAPLDEQISSDNPQWLGERLASTRIPPFYINLYKQQENDQPVADAIINLKLALTPLLHHNLSSIRLKLQQTGSPEKNRLLYNNFIHFNHKTMDNIQQDYLDSNIPIQMDAQTEKLKGEIDLYLPREFIVQQADFETVGQTIKSDSLQITLIKQTSRSLEFAVSGDLKTLVQLKIYNRTRMLISDLMEYNQIDDSHARLSLIYYGEPALIKLITGKNILSNQYQFEL